MDVFFAKLRGSQPRRERGFTLVTVLIVLSLLAVIAVGFLSSMTAERSAAAAYANKVRAEQMAQAGADAAMATMRQCFRDFPDSCTVWDRQQSRNDLPNADGSASYNEGTDLYFRAVSPTPLDQTLGQDSGVNRPPMIAAGAGIDQRKIYVLPLTSGVVGAVGKLETAKASALPVLTTSVPDFSKRNFAEMNAPRYKGDTEGWIGSPPGHTDKDASGALVPKPFRAPWVELTDAKGSANGRYAFWIEDESFKTNVNQANLGQAHKRRDNAANPAAADPLGYMGPADFDLLAPLIALGDASASEDAQGIVDTRKSYPNSLFPEARGLAHTPWLDATLADKMRYLATTVSGGLNLSRHGSQRLNLNAAIPAATDPKDSLTVQRQLNKIVKTIQFHAPNFGQRFYRKSAAPTPAALNGFDVGADSVGDHALIYDYKVAANIHDYMDNDSLPTVVMAGGTVAGVSKPLIAPNHPPWAMGKDSAPFIQECAVQYRGDVTNGKYTLVVDYYIEVWNMTTKDILPGQLGSTAFIRIANPVSWGGTFSNLVDPSFNNPIPLEPDDGGPNPSESRTNGRHPCDFDIDISNVTFPAGRATVITTDDKANHRASRTYETNDYKDVITNLEAREHVISCSWKPPGKSVFQGKMPSKDPQGATDLIRLKFEDGSSDYQTDLLIGNEDGYIDFLVTIPLSYSGGSTGFRFNDPKAPYAPLGGYLRGNWTNTGPTDGLGPSALGDPRTNNEQLDYYQVETSPASENTRYKNFMQQAAHAPVPLHPSSPGGVLPTLGLPNYMSCRPNRAENPWPDFAPYYAAPASPTKEELVMNEHKAPMVVLNGALSSIGQLGDLFDPARNLSTPTAILSARGGGRTFKIGQHDDRWDGDQASESRAWPSWRLLDFFSIADHPSQPRLVDYYSVEQPGVINVNGVARDHGAAFRAAAVGFNFQPSTNGDITLGGDGGAAGKSVPLNFDKVVSQMIDRVTAPLTKNNAAGATTPNTGMNQTGAGPFWERGELSELPLFGRTPSTNPYLSYPAKDLTSASPPVDVSLSVYDRGREELFRRLSEMITTRGDTFTVYVVGQAIQQPPPTSSNPNPARTYSALHRQKVTFKLVPKAYDAAKSKSIAFHPGVDGATGQSLEFELTAAGIKDRFAKPDHYDIQVIASSVGF